LVQDHWGSGPIQATAGVAATELVDALHDGRVRAVWIAGSNPVVSLPDAERARGALQRAEFLVVQDLYHPTDTSLMADLVLPAAAWGEKTGTMTSSERRVALADAAVAPPGEALEDWRIFAGLGSALGHRAAFTYRDAADVFDEHVTLTRGSTCDMSGLSHERLRRDGPLQWPCPAPDHPGLARRYTDGVFTTSDGRARFHATPFRPPAEEPDAAYPLRLTTVRDADSWHTLTRTGKVAALRRGADRPLVDVHPDDARSCGVEDGDAVEVVSRRGRWRGYARCTTDVPPGTLSASFHWSSLRDARAVANRVMPAALDPRSKQPELKHAAVQLLRATPLDHMLVIGGAGAPALAAALVERGCDGATAMPWGTAPPASGAWCVVAEDGADWDAWRRAESLPDPLFVDAGARIAGSPCGHAVGAPIITTGGLHVSDDPVRQAVAILSGGAGGPRRLAAAGVSEDGERTIFTAGDAEPATSDDEQGIHTLEQHDGSRRFSVAWRLAGGQVLGVSASGPRDAVEEVAAAWNTDVSPEELVHGAP
ncbi:MAG: molybdopterin oxidoreductase family protein, partial [Candidatus Dormibacteria bacterium]